MAAGEFSAAKIGTQEPLRPIPMPISRRVIRSCSHVCDTAPPIGVMIRKTAETKMVPYQTQRASQQSISISYTTSNVVIYGVRQPAAQEGTSNVRSCVDKANKPVVAVVVWIVGTSRFFTSTNAKLLGKR